MTATTSIGKGNMAPLKAARCRRRSEKRSEPECPHRGVFRLDLKLDQSNLKETGVRQGLGLGGEAALRWPGASLQGLMKDVDTRIESLLELGTQARQACSQLLIRGLQRLDLVPGRVECFLVGNHLRRSLCPALLSVLHGLLNRGKLIADSRKVLGNVRGQSLNVILAGVGYRE